MIKPLVSILLLCAATLAAQAQGQKPPRSPDDTGSAVKPLGDDALYRALGGQDGLRRLMADFVPRVKADPQIGVFFKDTNLEELQKQLTQQFCLLAGGPCRYEGANMKNVHADFQIRKADFNRLVELLQQSMDARQIPFAAQNRMLAQLAPMHRDVITVR